MKMRTLGEAADELGTTRYKLRCGIMDGRYPFLAFGGRRLVDIDVLRPLIEAEEADGGMVRIQACAEQIGVSQSTLRRMVSKGLVPYERRGKQFYFNVRAVKQALEDQMASGK